MVFSSFLFLFCFLPLSLLFYYGYSLFAHFTRRNGKGTALPNSILLGFSYLFYAWGAPKIIPLLFLSSLTDYLLSRIIASSHQSVPLRLKKLAVWLGIVSNISFLLYFKYTNFFLHEINTILQGFNFTGIHWSAIALPIGVSFFTFQKISYLVDVSRGKAEPAANFVDYALYVSLFPQLIAGPIVRYHEIATQLRRREHTWEKFVHGCTRFSYGLAKKVLIADFLGQSVDAIFALQTGELTTTFAWFGILAYTFQIYFDFSGYSDMAIGLGLLFGFSLPENFRYPYLARSFRDFWTRWHITLSQWMFEYLYLPLGGNRVSRIRSFFNLWTVFLLSGLWHGASWNFVLWGAYHGFFLSGERLLFPNSRKFFAGSQLFIFPLLTLSWVLFRATDLQHGMLYYQHLFGLQPVIPLKSIVWGELVTFRELAMFFLAALVVLLPVFSSSQEGNRHQYTKGEMALGYLLLLLSLCALAGIDYTPFLYFRF